MDAEYGRFLSVDPLAGERENLSTYNYVQCNPIYRIDPTGALDTLPDGRYMHEMTQQERDAVYGSPDDYNYSRGTREVLQRQRLEDVGLLDAKLNYTWKERFYEIGHMLGFAMPSSKVLKAASAANKGDRIALGVSEHLDEFANSVNASTWKTWAADDFATQFINKIKDPSTQINFNLTGPSGESLNVWKSVQEGSKGLGKSRATSWELFQIYSDPAVLQRSTFYLNGKVVPSPF